MAVIPVQTGGGVDHRGHVIVFDEADAGVAATRWSIVDPIGQRFWNHFLPAASPNGTTNRSYPIPHEDDGDPFCSGHAWTKDGLLFVAGGTVWDLNPPPPALPTFWAARLAYLWDPTSWNVGNGGWNKQLPLEQGRYYPSVTRFGDDRLMVSGGFDKDVRQYFATGPVDVESTYEVFRVTQNQNPPTGQFETDSLNFSQVYTGPEEPEHGEFNFYPRFHLLADPTGGTTGWMFYAGFAMDNGRNVHDATQSVQDWKYDVGDHPSFGSSDYLHYVSTVLRPIDLNAANPGEDRIMRFGGGQGGYLPQGLYVRNDVEICKPTGPGPDGQWQSYPAPMKKARMHANVVLLPDGTTLVVGGTATEVGNTGFVMTAELLAGAVWTETLGMASGRGYHSVAVLLPNGMILCAGGEGRMVDYQLYKPPYFFKGPRPVITSAVTGGLTPDRMVVSGATVYELTYTCAPGTQAEKVVLMRPCSVTHHSDFDQRSVALEQVAAPDGMLRFKAPPSDRIAPLGHYMLFVVDSNCVPSEATWVKLDSTP